MNITILLEGNFSNSYILFTELNICFLTFVLLESFHRVVLYFFDVYAVRVPSETNVHSYRNLTNLGVIELNKN